MPYTDEQRQARMRADKLRKMGRPRRILPHEFAVAEAKIRDLHGRGMSIAALAAGTGIGRRTLGRIIHAPGTAKSLWRDHHDKLMALTYEEPGADTRGARLDPAIAVRLVGALWAAGYRPEWQAEQIGTSPQQLSKLAKGATKVIHWSYLRRILDLYDKAAHASPEEFGLSPMSIRKARSGGLGRGFAPPSCWDDDTLTDPSAIPEWTGACGTVEGRLIHKREGIPLCDPCATARADLYAEEPVFDHEYLTQLMEARPGLTSTILADRIGVSHNTVSTWRTGRRRPSQARLLQLADALGVKPEGLMT